MKRNIMKNQIIFSLKCAVTIVTRECLWLFWVPIWMEFGQVDFQHSEFFKDLLTSIAEELFHIIWRRMPNVNFEKMIFQNRVSFERFATLGTIHYFLIVRCRQTFLAFFGTWSSFRFSFFCSHHFKNFHNFSFCFFDIKQPTTRRLDTTQEFN